MSGSIRAKDSVFKHQPSNVQFAALTGIEIPNRDLLLPGKYETEFTIDVYSKVNVAEDGDRANSIPWKAIALALLEQHSPEAFLKLVRDVLEEGKDKRDDLGEALSEIVKPILGRIPVHGKITTDTLVKLHK